MQLQNREGVRGMSVQITNAELLLTDFVMQISTPSVIARNMRLESRSDWCLRVVPDIQIGRPGSGVATLFIGDVYACCPKPFVVGAQATANKTPSNTLTVNGTLSCSGQISGKMFSAVAK